MPGLRLLDLFCGDRRESRHHPRRRSEAHRLRGEHYSHTEPLAELKDALRQREGWLVGEYVLAFEFLTPDQQQGIYTMTITSEGPLQPRHRLARVLCHQLDAEGPFDPHPKGMP